MQSCVIGVFGAVSGKAAVIKEENNESVSSILSNKLALVRLNFLISKSSEIFSVVCAVLFVALDMQMSVFVFLTSDGRASYNVFLLLKMP